MSRFKDLEHNLEEEAAAKQSTEEEKARKLLEARASCMPLLERAYAVLGDFYTTILQPKGYRLFPRKKEGLTPNELRNMCSQTILFAYVANVLSPRNEQPYSNSFDSLRVWTHPQIGELDYHVWHPNVGLHFATYITPRERSVEEVKLSIGMRAWGKVDLNETTPSPKGLSIVYADAGWDHFATSVFIEPDETHIEDQVDTGLRLLTPNIIHHKEAFFRR